MHFGVCGGKLDRGRKRKKLEDSLYYKGEEKMAPKMHQNYRILKFFPHLRLPINFHLIFKFRFLNKTTPRKRQ